MELVLQNPQQCAELMQLCLAKKEVLAIPSISIEDETCTTVARSIYRGGRGGRTFKTINGQWNPTTGPSTQGGHYFFC
jgi:hypothetical protein